MQHTTVYVWNKLKNLVLCSANLFVLSLHFGLKRGAQCLTWMSFKCYDDFLDTSFAFAGKIDATYSCQCFGKNPWDCVLVRLRRYSFGRVWIHYINPTWIWYIIYIFFFWRRIPYTINLQVIKKLVYLLLGAYKYVLMTLCKRLIW